MLGMKGRCLVVEVVGCPRADGGRPPTGAGTSASLWRCSTLSRSAMKSRLPKRKAWDGPEMGGTHIPTGEPKRIVSLEPVIAKVAEKWAI